MNSTVPVHFSRTRNAKGRSTTTSTGTGGSTGSILPANTFAMAAAASTPISMSLERVMPEKSAAPTDDVEGVTIAARNLDRSSSDLISSLGMVSVTALIVNLRHR